MLDFYSVLKLHIGDCWEAEVKMKVRYFNKKESQNHRIFPLFILSQVQKLGFFECTINICAFFPNKTMSKMICLKRLSHAHDFLSYYVVQLPRSFSFIQHIKLHILNLILWFWCNLPTQLHFWLLHMSDRIKSWLHLNCV